MTMGIFFFFQGSVAMATRTAFFIASFPVTSCKVAISPAGMAMARCPYTADYLRMRIFWYRTIRQVRVPAHRATFRPVLSKTVRGF